MRQLSRQFWRTRDARAGASPRAVLFVFCAACVVSSCNFELDEQGGACVPQCTAGNYCADDGCGGVCPCAGGYVCNAEGICVEDDGICTQDCDSFATPWECGTICGNLCGTCPADEKCVSGQCECRPQCDGTHCGQDGCGGMCECADGTTCNAEGMCVADDCSNPCQGRQCGVFCGESCGTCDSEFETCNASGQCECHPQPCDGTRCDDGCGGACECDGDQICDEEGLCVDECDSQCGSEGWECGELCGVECGPCEANEECVDHVCVCQPSCDGTRCDDGCGGTCVCAEGTTCDLNGDCVESCEDTCGEAGWVCGEVCGEVCGDCPDGESCVEGSCWPSSLRLELVSNQTLGLKNIVTLAVKYSPRTGEPQPRMVDLRLDTDKLVDLEVDSVTPWPAMDGKELYLDPISLKPWKMRPDGSVQLLIYSTGNLDRIPAGTLLRMVFEVDLGEEDAVSFRLVRRQQTFAPFEADFAVQESAYDLPVAVTR